MEEQIRISELMVKHHSYIVELFNNFKNNIGDDYDAMNELFGTFEQGLRRHLSTEEDVIFKICDVSSKTVADSIHNLITQHFTIREILKTIKLALETRQEIVISDLDKLLMAHKNYEELVLYPTMDAELDDWTKDEIIEAICALEKSTTIQDFE